MNRLKFALEYSNILCSTAAYKSHLTPPRQAKAP